MKKFLIGLLLEFLVIIAFVITKDEKIFIYGTQIIAFGSIGTAVILSGLLSNNIYRRTAVEDKDERIKRVNRTSTFILLGTPSMIILIVYYFFIK